MYLRPSEAPVQAVPDASVHITLDWSNRQSHRLYEDRVISGAVWSGAMDSCGRPAPGQ